MIKLTLEQEGVFDSDYPEPNVCVSFEHDQDTAWNPLLESFLKGLNALGYIINVEEMMDVLQMYTEERIKLLFTNKEKDVE